MAKSKQPSVSAAPFDVDSSKYEGSYKDWRNDYREANRRGISVEAFEDSAADRIKDKAGQKKMNDGNALKASVNHDTGYKPGTPAFKNTPKMSHGYGHTGAQRQGALRCSGSAGAHRIGSKKK